MKSWFFQAVGLAHLSQGAQTAVIWMMVAGLVVGALLASIRTS